MKYTDLFAQRTAGWCKAEGILWKYLPEWLPEDLVGTDGFARYSDSVSDAVRSVLRDTDKPEVVPRNLRPLSERAEDFIFWRIEYETV